LEVLMPAGRSTFTKRQKEQTRMQKRQDKLERKKQRAEDKTGSGPEIDWEAAAAQQKLHDEDSDSSGQNA
jgi:hypothetical protein